MNIHSIDSSDASFQAFNGFTSNNSPSESQSVESIEMEIDNSFNKLNKFFITDSARAQILAASDSKIHFEEFGNIDEIEEIKKEIKMLEAEQTATIAPAKKSFLERVIQCSREIWRIYRRI